jgi:hypothetical protein
VELAVPDLEAASVGGSVDSICLAASSGDAARMSSRSLSSFFLAAAVSVSNAAAAVTRSESRAAQASAFGPPPE